MNRLPDRHYYLKQFFHLLGLEQVEHNGEVYTFDDVCYNPIGPYT